MRTFGTLGVAILAAALIACAPAAPTVAPKQAPAAPTTAAAPTAANPGNPGTSSQPAAKIKRGGILVSATNAFPPSMDPIYETIGTQLKEMGMYEALLRYEVTDWKEGNLQLKPELAESWKQVDPKTITLQLRKGVKFHDGSEMTAEVVKWSLERMGTQTKSLSKRFTDNIASIEVMDPYSIKINYKNPSALQLLNLTIATAGTGSIGPAILSKAQMDKVGEEAFGAGKASTTGPFKLVEWKRDNEFILTKNENYWKTGDDGQKLPYLDGLRYRLITDTAVHQVELKAGSVHVSRALAPADLPAIKSDPNLQYILVKWAPNRLYFGFNDQKSPFGTNLKLRQAAQYATDRENFAKILGLEAGTPNYYLGWIPSWSGYDPSLPKYEFNLEKARQLVQESGVSNPEIVLLHQTQTLYRRMAEMTQAMWGKIGIKVTLEPAEQAAGRQKIKIGEFEMHEWSMAPSPDPAHFERMFTCEGAANWSNYCNKEMDKCMAEAQAELDPAKRAEIYKKCQKIAYEDAQLGGLHLADIVLVHRKEVKNIKMQSHSEDLQEVWLDK